MEKTLVKYIFLHPWPLDFSKIYIQLQQSVSVQFISLKLINDIACEHLHLNVPCSHANNTICFVTCLSHVTKHEGNENDKHQQNNDKDRRTIFNLLKDHSDT